MNSIKSGIIVMTIAVLLLVTDSVGPELQQVPMDLISWTMKKSHSWDLQKDQN